MEYFQGFLLLCDFELVLVGFMSFDSGWHIGLAEVVAAEGVEVGVLGCSLLRIALGLGAAV